MSEAIFHHIQRAEEARTGRGFRFIKQSERWIQTLLRNLEVHYSVIPLYNLEDLTEYLAEKSSIICSQVNGETQRKVVYIDYDENFSKETWTNGEKWKLLELCDEHGFICIEDIVYMDFYPQQQETKTLWELASYFPNVSLIHIGQEQQEGLKLEDQNKGRKKEWVLLSQVSTELLRLCPMMHDDQTELEQLKKRVKHDHHQSELSSKASDSTSQSIATQFIQLSEGMKNKIKINKTSRSHHDHAELWLELPNGLQSSTLMKAIHRSQPLFTVLDQTLFRVDSEQNDVLIVALQHLKQNDLKLFVEELDEVISQFTARS